MGTWSGWGSDSAFRELAISSQRARRARHFASISIHLAHAGDHQRHQGDIMRSNYKDSLAHFGHRRAGEGAMGAERDLSSICGTVSSIDFHSISISVLQRDVTQPHGCHQSGPTRTSAPQFRATSHRSCPSAAPSQASPSHSHPARSLTPEACLTALRSGRGEQAESHGRSSAAAKAAWRFWHLIGQLCSGQHWRSWGLTCMGRTPHMCIQEHTRWPRETHLHNL